MNFLPSPEQRSKKLQLLFSQKQKTKKKKQWMDNAKQDRLDESAT